MYHHTRGGFLFFVFQVWWAWTNSLNLCGQLYPSIIFCGFFRPIRVCKFRQQQARFLLLLYAYQVWACFRRKKLGLWKEGWLESGLCLSGETPMLEDVIGVLGGPAPEGVLEEDDTVRKPCSNLATGTRVTPATATFLARCEFKLGLWKGVCLSRETPMVEEVIGVLGGPAPEGVLEEDDTVLKPCSNLVKGTCVCPEDATLLARCRVKGRRVCRLCHTRSKRLRYAAQKTKSRDPDH